MRENKDQKKLRNQTQCKVVAFKQKFHDSCFLITILH